jgi:nucleotidyltransferase/DNA polymerase involved in DNA repair
MLCLIHIDSNNNFILGQVERSYDPKLIGKPCAVVQYNPFGDLNKPLRQNDNRIVTNNGGIIAVSYEARALGVTRSMRGLEAKEKCSDIFLVQVPTNHGKADLTIYRDAGAKVVNVLKTFNCTVEKASIDEVYVDITNEVEKRMLIASSSSSSSSSNYEVYEQIFQIAQNSMIAGSDKKELQMSKSILRKGHEGTEEISVDDRNTNQDLFNAKQFYLHGLESDKRLIFGAVIISEMRRLVYEKLQV